MIPDCAHTALESQYAIWRNITFYRQLRGLAGSLRLLASDVLFSRTPARLSPHNRPYATQAPHRTPHATTSAYTRGGSL